MCMWLGSGVAVCVAPEVSTSNSGRMVSSIYIIE